MTDKKVQAIRFTTAFVPNIVFKELIGKNTRSKRSVKPKTDSDGINACIKHPKLSVTNDRKAVNKHVSKIAIRASSTIINFGAVGRYRDLC